MLEKTDDLSHVQVASCGIGSWYVGELPDARMRSAARRRGVELTKRAEQFQDEFFDQFDLIIACDQKIYHALLQKAATATQKSKVQLLSSFCTKFEGEDIADPYYGGEEAFELALDILEDACQGIVERLRSQVAEG